METSTAAQEADQELETTEPAGHPLPRWFTISLVVLVVLELLAYAGLAYSSANSQAFPWAEALGMTVGGAIGLLIVGYIINRIYNWLFSSSDDNSTAFWSPRAWPAISAVAILLSPIGAVYSGSGSFLINGYATVFPLVAMVAWVPQFAYNQYQDWR